MSKTQAQLISRALTLLQRLGEGDSPSDGDRELVSDNITPLVAMLSAEGVVNVGSVDEIDDAVFLPLARLLANECAPDFGQPYSDETRARAIMQLNRVLSVPATSQPLATDYF